MGDQRIEGRAALDGVDLGHRRVRRRKPGEAVDRLGRHADQPAGAQEPPPLRRSKRRLGRHDPRRAMRFGSSTLGMAINGIIPRMLALMRRTSNRVSEARILHRNVNLSNVAPPASSGEPARRPLPHDARMFQHIDAVGVRQREGDVLLAEQHRDVGRRCAAAPAPARSAPARSGRGPRVGSSRISRSGLVISARAMVSICCSPPERVPAVCPTRSFRRGNSSNSQSSRSARSRAPSRSPPMSRFSRTVMSPNRSRPSGACTIAAARDRGGVAPRSAAALAPDVAAHRAPAPRSR